MSCFEARADEGTGVLQTLTTLSKLVLMELRKTVDDATPQPRPAQSARVVEEIEPLGGPPTGEITASFDDDLAVRVSTPVPLEKGFVIESAGPVDGGGREICIPVRLIDEATGRRVEIAVRIAIDAL